MAHKSGFVNIIGNPNVGKSTLMNALMGEKLSIVTQKAQTTRHRIMGILSGEDFQIVYSDTPGIIKPHHKMHEGMMEFVKNALIDADLLLYVTDVVEKPDKNSEYLEKLKKMSEKIVVVINKIDLSSSDALRAMEDFWKNELPGAEVVIISAKESFNLEKLVEVIKNRLPEGEAYYDKDELTDKPERFFVSEILRGCIFENYRKELPYSSEVVVESFKEDDKIIKIQTVIYVERETQKGILIGKGGLALKKTASQARKRIEQFFQKKIFLETFVKVKKDWRNNDLQLKNFGYIEK